MSQTRGRCRWDTRNNSHSRTSPRRFYFRRITLSIFSLFSTNWLLLSTFVINISIHWLDQFIILKHEHNTWHFTCNTFKYNFMNQLHYVLIHIRLKLVHEEQFSNNWHLFRKWLDVEHITSTHKDQVDWGI